MSDQLTAICQWCEQPFIGNRKFCSRKCRHQAQGRQAADPTPEEIREMCRRIRYEGGAAWERNRCCYPPQPVQMRVVSTSSVVARGE